MKLIILTITLLSIAPSLLAQTIRGSVCDAQTRSPLEGASIQQKNTSSGTLSQVRGMFELVLDRQAPIVLVVRHLGYETKELDLQEFDLTLTIDLCLNPTRFKGEEVVVQAVRADAGSAVTHSNMSKSQIEERNTGRDLPFLLQSLPSVVTTSDAGAGIGYTGMRIRGVDQARINVTINGIPLNDPESHEVFWVNMPDFASSVESIQVQRGVGTSTNGSAAFGASVNIQTKAVSDQPYGSVTTALGSFNTRRVNAQLGTGLLEGMWSLDGRLSTTQSDGYIDRAFSDLNSWFVTGARSGKRSLLKMNVFSGKERTYQAWNGVPEELLSSNRRYNEFTYDNQTDNYRQTHLQLHYTAELHPKVNLHSALHYTRGLGFYEEFRENDRLSRYGISDIVIEGQTITRTDLIRRRWLDNHFYGTVGSVEVGASDKVDITLGGAFNMYDNDHYGEVIWARFAGNSTIRQRYYNNNGYKKDGSGFLKGSYALSTSIELFGDLQLRRIHYDFLGLDNDGAQLDQSVDYRFFNPKTGINIQITPSSRAYLGFGISHKEPTRKEFTESSPSSRPKAERLNNLEIGWRLEKDHLRFGASGYWMDYENQLIPTGQINDVGSYTRSNVKDSYRLGLELDAQWQAHRSIQVGGSLGVSRNRIPSYVEYVDVYQGWDWIGQEAINWGSRPISFSPSVVAGSTIQWNPWRDLSLKLDTRYISRQYLDNTGTSSRSLDPYSFFDLNTSYRFKVPGFVQHLHLQASLLNLTNRLYESNGYTFGWIQDEERLSYNYYYPQAGRHFMIQLGIQF
jgi:iron complex outermembrane recepter protein